MRWLETAAVRPHRCACIPFIAGSQAEGFFDFGTEIQAFDGHVYVSVVAAKQMAEAMGWAPKGPDQSAAKVEKLQAELDGVRDELAQAQAELEAVHVLKRGGFASSRKPGRPKAVA